VKQNFNELFSKMKPEAQEWVKGRSRELLQAMALADQRRAEAMTQQQCDAADPNDPAPSRSE
jgi:hypothetical protein